MFESDKKNRNLFDFFGFCFAAIEFYTVPEIWVKDLGWCLVVILPSGIILGLDGEECPKLSGRTWIGQT